MNLDPTAAMQLKPGETLEQFEKRKALVLKLQKFSGGANRTNIPAGRLVRLVLLFVVGVILVVTGLTGKNASGNGATAGGWAVQHLGPHGNDIAAVISGLLILAVTGFYIARALRSIRPS